MQIVKFFNVYFQSASNGFNLQFNTFEINLDNINLIYELDAIIIISSVKKKSKK